MSTIPSPDAGPAPVPGFLPMDLDDELPEEELDLEPSTTTGPPPPPSPTSSTPPDPLPADGDLDAGPPASSTQGSRPTDRRPAPSGEEISTYLEDELEELGANAFDAAGRLANRADRARTHTRSRLWP